MNAGREVVTKAFTTVFRHPVTPAQQGYFDNYLNGESQSGEFFSTLWTRVLGDFIQQAYSAIFMNQVKPDPRIIQMIQSDVTSGRFRDGEDIWTAVATSNESWFGAAKIDYEGKRDRCVGALGPACNGGVPTVTDPYPVNVFTTMDGRLMEYFRAQVAVGSILHDAACRNPQGVFCGAVQWGPIDPRTAVPLLNELLPASKEWAKAVWNVSQHRYWQADFGPYPVDPTAREAYSDDLRVVPNRPALLPSPTPIVFTDWPGLYSQADGGEDRATIRLSAPSGTALDSSDVAYCAARTASATYSAVVTSWIVCS
jgi:hypothetical protein